MSAAWRRTGLRAVATVVALLAVAAQVPVTATAAVSAVVGTPTATVGAFDCERLEVEVVLDNSRSTEGTTFGYGASFQRPLTAPYAGVDATTRVRVAAGAVKVVVVPVRDDARTVVIAYLPDGGHVVSTGACGQAPSAVFGLADCDVLTRSLTLDNSSTARPTRYRWTLSDPAGPLRTATVDVDAGLVTEVDVPLVEGSTSTVAVEVEGKGLVAGSDPRSCGTVVQDPRARFGQVDCGNVSAPVLLDNSRTTHRVRFHVPGRGDVVLAAGETRGFGLHLPIAERLSLGTRGTPVAGASTELAVASTARCADVPAR